MTNEFTTGWIDLDPDKLSVVGPVTMTREAADILAATIAGVWRYDTVATNSAGMLVYTYLREFDGDGNMLPPPGEDVPPRNNLVP